LSAVKRIKAGRLVRIVRTSVALAMRLAAVAPAHVASADSVDVARVQQQLEEAQYARIGIEGRTHVLIKARAVPEGLGFERVEKVPRRRYEVVAGELEVVPPPNPAPWSRIDQVEVGVHARLQSTFTGAAIGLATGAAMGAGLAAFGNGMSGSDWSAESWGLTLGSGAIFAVVGAGIGALAPATRWKQVYPQLQN